MPDYFDQLCDNLETQINLYGKLEGIENRKNDAILKKNGSLLKDITSEEERLIREIDLAEGRRLAIMETLNRKHNIATDSGILTLKQVAEISDNINAKRITDLGTRLKSQVLCIKAINEVNMKMMKDSIEFFRLTIDGIKDSAGKNEAYSSRGEHRIEQMKRPLIFSKTV